MPNAPHNSHVGEVPVIHTPLGGPSACNEGHGEFSQGHKYNAGISDISTILGITISNTLISQDCP